MANTLAAELILDISKFRKAISQAQRSINGAFKGSGGIAAGIVGGAAAITTALVTVISAAAAIAGYRAGKIIAQGVAMAGDLERIQMRFEILTGSREQGNRALADLRADAMRTGIVFEDMSDTVAKFIAFGFNPDEAMKLNKGILDVGGSVGLTTRDMKLLGVALSQVAAKGVANMEELRQQIAEKGIPIFKALEHQLGVTGAELSKMIQNGEVSSMDVMDLFTGVVDGEGFFAKFQGGADRMASTFLGSVARMKAIWNEFLRVFGGPIMDSLKPAMDAALVSMQLLGLQAENWGQAIADGISYLIAGIDVAMSIPWETYASLFRDAFLIAVYEIGNQLMGVIMGAGGALKGLLTGNAGEGFASGYESGSGFFDKDIEALAEGAAEALAPYSKRFQDLADDLMRQQRERSAERNRIASGADFSDASRSGGAAAPAGGFAINGALSQAINVISGRSAFSVMATEAIKSNAQQEKMNKTLDIIEKNTRTKSGPTGNLTVNKVQDYSRFA
jgi:tape measure domain-containing protein